jgi:ABC-type antimicrobial peptide transport system permease subunit
MQSVVEAIGGEIVTIVYPMTILMAIGIFLSAAGIYAVLAFAIARRSKEIALRIAIGATHRHVLRLVAGLSLRLLALGIAFGTVLMYSLSRLAQGSGSVFDSRTPAVFVVPILTLLAVGVLATCIPVRRAIRINPAALLRMQ